MPRTVDPGIYEHIYAKAAQVPGYARYQRYRVQIKSSADPLGCLARQEDVYWSVQAALQQIGVRQGGPARILEVGSGLGYLTYALNQAGYDCRGIDTSARAVACASGDFGALYAVQDLMQMTVGRDGLYDVIVALELIEHLADPAAFVRQAQGLLKPGGHLILTTPNQELYSRRYVWHTDPAPVHLWWFSKASLRQLAWQQQMHAWFIDFSAYYGAQVQPVPVATKPATFGAAGSIIARRDVVHTLAHLMLARMPWLFKPMARLFLRLRAWGRMRGELYRESLSLCVVMQKRGAMGSLDPS